MRLGIAFWCLVGVRDGLGQTVELLSGIWSGPRWWVVGQRLWSVGGEGIHLNQFLFLSFLGIYLIVCTTVLLFCPCLH